MNSGRKRSKASSTSIDDSDIPWYQQCEPQTTKDLAVHSGKVKEVESWFSKLFTTSSSSIEESSFNQIATDQSNNPSRTALLTGPAGSGKTATIKVLCKKYNVLIKDISDETSSCSQDSDSSQPREPGDSLVRKFKECVFNLCRKKKGSVGSNNRSLLLIEDLPTGFYYNVNAYHEVFRQMLKAFPNHHIPIVFIVSDTGESANSLHDGSSRSNMNSYHLFPPEFICEMNIQQIKFNPVAKTSILKALKRLPQYNFISEQDISTIALCGDLRGAFNSLELSYQHSSDTFTRSDPVKIKKVKLQASSNGVASTSTAVPQHVSSLHVRDRLDSTFHYTGKILYAKRIVPSDDLPETVRELPLVEDLIELSRRLPVPPDHLILHLHQMYEKFNKNRIDICAKMIENFSLADRLGQFEYSDMSCRASSQEIQTELAIRSSIFLTNPSLVNVTGDKYSGVKPWPEYDNESRGMIPGQKLEFYEEARNVKNLLNQVRSIRSPSFPFSVTQLFSDILFIAKPIAFQPPQIVSDREQPSKESQLNAKSIECLLNLTHRIREKFNANDEYELFDDDLDAIFVDI